MRMRSNKKGSRVEGRGYKVKGFTLVELLVALCIFSIMTAAVVSVLSSGLKVYKRIKSFSGTQTDALIALEKLERDLNNTFIITGIDFSGSAENVSFPAASHNQSNL